MFCFKSGAGGANFLELTKECCLRYEQQSVKHVAALQIEIMLYRSEADNICKEEDS